MDTQQGRSGNGISAECHDVTGGAGLLLRRGRVCGLRIMMAAFRSGRGPGRAGHSESRVLPGAASAAAVTVTVAPATAGHQCAAVPGGTPGAVTRFKLPACATIRRHYASRLRLAAPSGRAGIGRLSAPPPPPPPRRPPGGALGPPQGATVRQSKLRICA
jgi:hypothetical protein